MAESADTAWPQSVSKEAGKTTDPNPALIRQLKYRAFITYSHQDRRMAESEFIRPSKIIAYRNHS